MMLAFTRSRTLLVAAVLAQVAVQAAAQTATPPAAAWGTIRRDPWIWGLALIAITIVTRLPDACKARTCLLTASNTLAPGSARSAAKL